MLSLETYINRFTALKSQKELSNKQLLNFVKESIYQNELARSVPYNTYYNWVTGRKSIPPVQALAAIAKALDVSIGYLIGSHDVIEMTNTSTFIKINTSLIKQVYCTLNGTVSVYHEGSSVNWQWWDKITNKGTHKPLAIRPFEKLARELNWTVDFCLGLSNDVNWIQFALDNGLFHYIPEEAVFCIPKSDDTPLIFASLNADKTKAYLTNGKTVDASLLSCLGAKLLVKHITVS